MNQNSGLLSAESDRKQLNLQKTTAVVVPIRCFSGALSRLSGVLDDNRRAELMCRMAARVVAAAAPYPTFVATDDAAVSAWACYVGASPMPIGQPGLSAAAEVAVNRLAADGVERVVVAHADLVLARTLSPVVGPGPHDSTRPQPRRLECGVHTRCRGFLFRLWCRLVQSSCCRG